MGEQELKDLRDDIDKIDDRLFTLVEQRMRIVAKIAEQKRAAGLPVRVRAREEELLARRRAQASEDMAAYAGDFAKALFSISRRYQTAQTEKSLRCGLIGERLSHSYSPAIHARLSAYDYRLFELQAGELEDFLSVGNFDGLNVTIPYKKAVIPFCRELTDIARRCGSVNTICRRADGTLLGHNTDYEGFLFLLDRLGVRVAGKKALVLGSGGASATVCTALRDRGAREIVVVSRQGENDYVNLYEKHADAQLLVNATPVGMYPETGRCLVSVDKLPALEAVVDLIYHPAKTRLLLDAQRLGLPAMNGLTMLVAQAAASCECFTGRRVDRREIEALCREIEQETKNLLLIGMPGSGKSTIGAALAKTMDRPFVDSDERLEKLAGCSIPELIAAEGENAFREREHEVLEELTKQSGMVIAVGGGAVLREDNINLMRQNSTVIWLQRDLTALAVVGRPLSIKYGLDQLYAQREPLYRKTAALTVDNNGGVSDCVERILEACYE